MSFKSYTTTRLPDGGMILDDPQPLRFSGPHGLIARFVLDTAGQTAKKPPLEDTWRLGADELHALAAPSFEIGGRVIVFEQTDEDTMELLLLEVIHGVSTDRTDMMFRFRPLRLVSRAPKLHVEHIKGGKIYTEELSLEGGPLAPTANWKWRKPHLAIGGVVCGAAALPSSPLQRPRGAVNS